jgi:hypothetical protein
VSEWAVFYEHTSPNYWLPNYPASFFSSYHQAMAAPGRVPKSSTSTLTVGGGTKGDPIFSERVTSTINNRVVIDEAACGGDAQALAAQISAYLRQTYPRTLAELDRVRVCVNCKREFTMAAAMGRWECSRHYERDASCCAPGKPGVTSRMMHNGCIACDHQDVAILDRYYYQVGVCEVPQYLVRYLRALPEHVLEYSPLQLRLAGWASVVVDRCDHLTSSEAMFTVLTADLPLVKE